VIVVETGDNEYAVSGGNVCAIAGRRGIAGFVVDGVIRDLAEVREEQFPLFARGVCPKPGGKAVIGVLNGRVNCGGVQVDPGDIVIADEEGVVVVPAGQSRKLLAAAQVRAARDAAMSLEEWERDHHARIEAILLQKGFTGPES
jgi:regulator of RNase E activity RraA